MIRWASRSVRSKPATRWSVARRSNATSRWEESDMRRPLAQVFLLLARHMMPAAAATLALPASLAYGGTGDLDPTFGTGGRVSLDLGFQPGPTYSAIQQTDGKLVVASTIY